MNMSNMTPIELHIKTQKTSKLAEIVTPSDYK